MHLWLLARLHVLWALPIPDQSLALVFLHSTLTGFLALLTWFSCCNSSGGKKKRSRYQITLSLLLMLVIAALVMSFEMQMLSSKMQKGARAYLRER